MGYGKKPTDWFTIFVVIIGASCVFAVFEYVFEPFQKIITWSIR